MFKNNLHFKLDDKVFDYFMIQYLLYFDKTMKQIYFQKILSGKEIQLEICKNIVF